MKKLILTLEITLSGTDDLEEIGATVQALDRKLLTILHVQQVVIKQMRTEE